MGTPYPLAGALGGRPGFAEASPAAVDPPLAAGASPKSPTHLPQTVGKALEAPAGVTIDSTAPVSLSSNDAMVAQLMSRLVSGVAVARAQVTAALGKAEEAGCRSCYSMPLDWEAPGMSTLSSSLSDLVSRSYDAQLAKTASRENGGSNPGAAHDAASDAVRVRFFNAGVVPLVLDVIRFVAPTERVARQALEDAIQALCNVCFNHAAQMGVLQPALGAMQILIGRMRLDVANNEVQIKVSRCVATLTYENSSAQMQAVQCGAVESALAAIPRHVTNAFAVRKLTQLVATLLSCGDAPSRLARAGALDAVALVRSQGWFQGRGGQNDRVLCRALADMEAAVHSVMSAKK